MLRLRTLALSFLLAVAPVVTAASEDHSQHMHAPVQAAQTVQVKVPAVRLTDQDGRKVELRNDVIGDRVVVMGFVYTTCTTVCPVTSALFEQLQTKLGPRLGSEVRLVSMTVDPVRDTPARLKAYAARHHAGAEWRWLTGDTPTVTRALDAFGAYNADFTQHPAMILVLDGRSGDSVRLFGFPPPDTILAQVDHLLGVRKTR